MAKGRDRAYWMTLAVALLLALSVGMVPAAEALPSSLTAPWTPLTDPSANDSTVHTAPWTPLTDPDGNDSVVMPQSDTSFGTLVGPTPGTLESLTTSDIAAVIVDPPGPFSAPATAPRVPEPATVILLGVGILALMIMGWRRAESLRRQQ